MSTFGGLTRASTALWAAQRGMDVTGQNISNVNTDGYSRQRVELQSITAPSCRRSTRPATASARASTPTRSSGSATPSWRPAAGWRPPTPPGSPSRAPPGAGRVGLPRAGRHRYPEHARRRLERLQRRRQQPHRTQRAARSQVLERLETLAGGIRTTATTLDKQWENTRDALEAMVSDVNTTATVDRRPEPEDPAGHAGRPPVNELSDQRDVLVMKLAEQVGATAVPREDGTVDVAVGGTARRWVAASAVSSPARGPGRGTRPDPPRLVTAPGGTRLRSAAPRRASSTCSARSPELPRPLDSLPTALATDDEHTARPRASTSTATPGGRCSARPPAPARSPRPNLTVGSPTRAKIAAAGVGPRRRHPDGQRQQRRRHVRAQPRPGRASTPPTAR